MKKTKSKAKKFFTDFKEFATKGNVLDMAVGVIMGGAFGKIVSSLVADIFMPFISLIVGGNNVSELKWIWRKAVMEGDIILKPEVALSYGNFIQSIIDFLCIAFCIYLFLRAMMKLKETSDAMAASGKKLFGSKTASEEGVSDEVLEEIVASEEIVEEIEEVAAATIIKDDTDEIKKLLTEIRDALVNKE